MDDDTLLLIGAGALAYITFFPKQSSQLASSVGAGVVNTGASALSGASLAAFSSGYGAGLAVNQAVAQPIVYQYQDTQRESQIASRALDVSSGFTAAKGAADPLAELAAAFATLTPSARMGATSILNMDPTAQALLPLAAPFTSAEQAGTAVWDAFRAGWNTLPLGGVVALR